MPGSAGLSADEKGVTVDLDRRQFLAGAATVAGVAAIGVAGTASFVVESGRPGLVPA